MLGPEESFLRGKTLLVVDEDDASREMLVAVLEFYGARVIQASDLEMALGRLRAFVPDLVLTDIRMRDPLDGFKLLEVIRSSPRPDLARIPVIAVTAYADALDKIWNSKFDDALIKPVRFDLVHRVVARHLAA